MDPRERAARGAEGVVASLKAKSGLYFSIGQDEKALCVRELLKDIEKSCNEARGILDGYIKRDMERRQRGTTAAWERERRERAQKPPTVGT